MFCGKCGNKCEAGQMFCGKCGNQIGVQQSSQVLTTSKKKIEIGKILKKYQKPLLFSISVLVLVVACFFIYDALGGNVKLSWDESYKDYNLEYVSQSNVSLAINLEGAELSDVKYDSTCGEVTTDGREINWNLTDALGSCKLTASYKQNKITKEYKVIDFEINKQGPEDLVFDDEVDLDSDEDLDLDKLTNKEEKEYNTNPKLSDSDMDGLDDYYEIFTSKTNPNKADTDGDGLNDYDEIELGLDPLKDDSKGDGIKDGERSLSYTIKDNDVTLTIKGKGNIASSTVNITDGTKISLKVGMIDKLYTFYTSGKLEEATVEIKYTDDELKDKDINEDNLSLFYFNEEKETYEKVETNINKDKNILTAKLTHFSNYVIGDIDKVKESSTNQVLFVLDNSWSMYTTEQYEELTGEEYSGGWFGPDELDGFDAEGLRFTLTSEFVTKLDSKGYKIGLSEFRRDYKNAFSLGSDAESIKEHLKTMHGNFITNTEGTDIVNALNKAIDEFSEETDNKYIILLTDGQDSSLNRYVERIIDNANENNVKICAIGFGGSTYNTPLANISNATGCNFFSSTDANGLTELFDNVNTELSNDLVDVDGDGENDGILIADSGFIVNRDGFSFSNYGSDLSAGGHCYGMATFAELYYLKKLPLSLDSKKIGEDTSYAYDLNGTYFDDYESLYDYKLQTNALKYYFGYDYFNEEMPSDFRTVKDNTLTYSDTYLDEIEASGLFDLIEGKSSLSKEEQMEKYGFNYEKGINALLSEQKMQNSSVIAKDDKNMFNAIYASFIKQNTAKHYSSGMDFILFLRNLFGTEDVVYDGKNGFINVLTSRLRAGDPLVMSSSFSGGLHAVNAISLVQDTENPNYYYIGVYDNNYPGEKRYVDLECNKKTCVTKANSYYTSSGEPIRITASLEDDLSFFE